MYTSSVPTSTLLAAEMALSFTASFFIGWAVGVCTISLVIAIIVLTLRGSARGASVFALLRINHKSGGAENSTKQTAAATNVPTPEHDPLPLFVPNPITWQHRKLHERLYTVVGPKGIHENVGYERFIENLALKLVYGGQNPAIEPTIMPTIDRSMFDDRELIRLAGNPPEGQTWSELISDRDTRYYAIWTFLIRLIYKRMHPTYNKVPSGDYNLSHTGHLTRDMQECLLPPEVTSCLHLIPNRYVGLTEDLVSVWRETLLMLLMPRYKLIHIPSFAFPIDGSDPRQKKIDSMASEIADALNMEALDACRRPVGVVKKRLGNELGRAANAALIFFGQPSEWEVDWTSDPGRLVAPRIRFMWNGQVKWTRPGVLYPGTPWDPIEVEKFEK
ncbi:hypothetical protein H9Q69_013974 [Fusarium xylarioides]|nr:hypothetical protein H9Q69_013974 [Fusarium xylarioides]KAG5813751.1 hypothetical protein H9Q71_003579 [Fusarium xylarioides]KAG5825323.1 hypothetical protein H9Q74_004593 [Fusarium xylarioides]